MATLVRGGASLESSERTLIANSISNRCVPKTRRTLLAVAVPSAERRDYGRPVAQPTGEGRASRLDCGHKIGNDFVSKVAISV